jgi:hypothetical protein
MRRFDSSCPARGAFRRGLQDRDCAEPDDEVDDAAPTREIVAVDVPERAMAPLEFDDDTIAE